MKGIWSGKRLISVAQPNHFGKKIICTAFLATFFSTGFAFGETKFESARSRGKDTKFAYEVFLPETARGPLPVIISIHGSNRDGRDLSDGEAKTDEFTNRLIDAGTEKGFAIVAIDAFFGTDLEPHQKKKFPQAFRFAMFLKSKLSKQDLYDPNNFFLTGFSYGGGATLSITDARVRYKNGIPWKAIAPTAPSCQVMSEPIKVPYPILMIKGEFDHYAVRACKLQARLLAEKGTKVSLEVIPGVNHFFSTPEGENEVVARNGCPDNPLIRYPDGTFRFYDGSGETMRRREARHLCFTNKGIAGKDRLKTDLVVSRVLEFFTNNLSK